MENENNEQIKRPERGPEPTKKEKTYRQALIIMAVLLLACVMFSGFQTLYIFRMNSGLEGTLTYKNYYNKQIEERTEEEYVDPIEAIENSKNAAATELPDPWFSLEDAASVNKKKLSTVEIVKLVSPATVSLSVVGVDDGKETKLGSGTGFIITEDGYIVTNQHVVVLADRAVSTYYVTVILPDEKQPVRAKVIGSDAQTDIAVLKVDTERKLPCVTLGNSDNLQAGELAVAIGNAMGTLDDTVTVGVISAPSREINRNGYYVDIIQTDAAINPGNSGGPLINSFGEVIGITNAKIISSTSENLGFAIRINSVKKIIEDIINYGKVVGRPYLGVSVTYVSDDAYFGAQGGVYVAQMVPGGPAEKAGLKIGDIILKLDGVEIKETGDIIKVRDSHKVGDVIEAVIIRDGKEMTRTIEIGDSADANE